MASPTAISKCFEVLVAEYGDRVSRNLTKEQKEVWLGVLADVDDELLLAATVLWLREAHPHPPRSGELRMLALKSAGKVRQGEALDAEAAKAWEVAHKFIRGDWTPANLTRWDSHMLEEAFGKEHPRAAAVLRRLGKPSDLGKAQVGDAVRNIRPNFIKTYVAMAGDAQQRREVKALAANSAGLIGGPPPAS